MTVILGGKIQFYVIFGIVKIILKIRTFKAGLQLQTNVLRNGWNCWGNITGVNKLKYKHS